MLVKIIFTSMSINYFTLGGKKIESIAAYDVVKKGAYSVLSVSINSLWSKRIIKKAVARTPRTLEKIMPINSINFYGTAGKENKN